MWVSHTFRFSAARSEPRLAVTHSTHDTNIWRLDTKAPAGANAPARPLIGSSQLDDSPQVSPDDRRIAFSSMRSGVQEIWTCDLEGSNCEQLVAAVDGGTPRWSPDGRFIAYDARPYVQSDVYSVELSTHLVRRITRDSADDAVPSWSRDGRSVYFASNRTGRGRSSRPRRKEARRCKSRATEASRPSRRSGAACSSIRSSSCRGLFRVPAGGGLEVQVLEQPHCWGHFAVTRDGVLYLDSTRQSRPVALFQKLGDGVAEAVASLGAAVPCAESSLTASQDRPLPVLHGRRRDAATSFGSTAFADGSWWPGTESNRRHADFHRRGDGFRPIEYPRPRTAAQAYN